MFRLGELLSQCRYAAAFNLSRRLYGFNGAALLERLPLAARMPGRFLPFRSVAGNRVTTVTSHASR